MADSIELSIKHQAFVEAYFACGMNASAAARKVGYKNRSNTAASQLMAHPAIRAEITRIRRENTISPEEILARLSEHGRADIADVTDAHGLLSMRKAQKNGKTGVIKSITHTSTTFKGVTTTTVKVELHDSQKALQMLGKYHKLFIDRVQVDDWRSQAIQDIKAGVLDYPTLQGLFDDDLAQELFRAAGVKVVVSDEE